MLHCPSQGAGSSPSAGVCRNQSKNARIFFKVSLFHMDWEIYKLFANVGCGELSLKTCIPSLYTLEINKKYCSKLLVPGRWVDATLNSKFN